MLPPSKLSRRDFLRMAGVSTSLLYLTACATPPASGPAAESGAAPAAAPAGPVVNSLGVELPADAAALEHQVMYLQGGNNISISADWFKVNYRQLPGTWLGGEPLAILDKNMELLPGAAESWAVMEDKVTWHFKLREGMQWSDGTPLTAQDWVNSFQYGADPATGFDFAWYFFFMKNWTAVNAGELPVDQLGCRAVDDYTLEVVTEYPAPYVPGWLSIAIPHPKHAFDAHGEAWSLQPETYVASGPFKLAKLEPDGETVWEINTKYTGPIKPLVEKIIYRPGTQPLGGSADDPQFTLAGYLSNEYYLSGPYGIPNISDLQRAKQDSTGRSSQLCPFPDLLCGHEHLQSAI